MNRISFLLPPLLLLLSEGTSEGTNGFLVPQGLSFSHHNPSPSPRNNPSNGDSISENDCIDTKPITPQTETKKRQWLKFWKKNLEDVSHHQQHHSGAMHQLDHRSKEKASIAISEKVADQWVHHMERAAKTSRLEKALERAAGAAERVGERAAERTGERLVERSAERAAEHGGERALERAGERAMGRAAERSAEIAGERASERLAERVGEAAVERVAERSGERALEKAAERASEYTAEKLGERAVERASQRFVESSAERLGERAMERAAEIAGDRAAERIGERHAKRLAEKTGEVAVERAAETMAERVGERAVERAGERIAGHTGERVAERGALERVFGVSSGKLGLRLGRGILIALPVLGGIFALCLLKADVQRLREDWKLTARSSSAFFLGAGLVDSLDAGLHFFIAFALWKHLSHKGLAIAEELSLGCAVVSTACAVVGEIVSLRIQKRRATLAGFLTQADELEPADLS